MRRVSAASAREAANAPNRPIAVTIRPRRVSIEGRERRAKPLKVDVIRKISQCRSMQFRFDHSQDRLSCAILQIGLYGDENSSFMATSEKSVFARRTGRGGHSTGQPLVSSRREAPEIC